MKDKDKLITELKAENERLKKLKCKFKEYCTCNTEKYKQTLQEIKAIAEKTGCRAILDIITGGTMNNFEKIKNMTLDEMARWLGANICNYCVYQKVNCDDIKQCKDGIKQWLQQESEG